MSRAVPALVLTALLAGAQLVPQSAAGVAVDQSWSIPQDGTITIGGHGFGHGHGMSQYGAEGAARQGKSWREILKFYYPGTEFGSNAGRVRVLLSADTSDDVVVGARPGLRVVNMATAEVWDAPDNGATRWRLVAITGGDTAVAWYDGSWHRWKTFTGDGAFRAGGQPITLYTPGAARQYRGTLIAASPSSGPANRDTVNLIRFDNYIKGVIPNEMPPMWSPAAVAAQAVAARTYASYEADHPRADHYQICDTSSCQVYGGFDDEHELSNEAVRATAGVILTYEGEPAFTQFASSSGGWTSANQFPYLPAKQDPYDDWAGNPVHDWKLKVTVARIEKAWPGVGNLKTIRVVSRDGNGEWQGRVWNIVLLGRKNGDVTRVSVSGDSFRYALGLRSTWFTIRNVIAD